MGRFQSIQVLRGLAALLVVLSHAFDFYPGMFGVDIFFVISGFIIAQIDKPPRQFIRDRLWRIYPIYLLCTLPWLFIEPDGMDEIMATVTLWPVWGNGFSVPLMPVAWTLCFEMLFYAAMALGMVTRPIVPLAIFLMSLGLFVANGHGAVAFFGSPIIFEFLGGMALARIRRVPRLAPLMIAFALIIWIGRIKVYSYHPGDIENFHQIAERALMWGMPAMFVVWGCISLESTFARKLFAPLVKLGDASYSLYLIHIAVVSLLAPLGGVVTMLTSIAAGLALHRYVEKPILRLRRDPARKSGLREQGALTP